MLRLETLDGIQDVLAGQTVIAPAVQWVRYSTPIALLPAATGVIAFVAGMVADNLYDVS